jgi:hypothetical protein
MQHLRTFAFSIGTRYQELEPMADLVSPNKTHNILSYEGWAYCARTPDKHIFLAYFEKGCPQAEVRGAHLNSVYHAQWFNPRNGTWQDVDINDGRLPSSRTGDILLPPLPEDTDWGLKLVYEGSLNNAHPLLIVEKERGIDHYLLDIKYYLDLYFTYAVAAVVVLVVLGVWLWSMWRRKV